MSFQAREKRSRACKERISAALEVLSKLLTERVRERKRAVKILEEVYKAKALQPIRGKAWPPDIWDKEMATVYAVAKYALLLHEEYPDVFHGVFSVEEALEEAGETILHEDPEKASKYVMFLLGGSVDSNTIARLLRVFVTQELLGFRSSDEVEELMRRLAKVFPEHEQAVRKYARYYIALKVAHAIALGEVRDRVSKEVLKQALAARLNLGKVIPDDEYIDFIARTVFGVPKKRLASVLSLERKEGSAAGSQPIA